MSRTRYISHPNPSEGDSTLAYIRRVKIVRKSLSHHPPKNGVGGYRQIWVDVVKMGASNSQPTNSLFRIRYEAAVCKKTSPSLFGDIVVLSLNIQHESWKVPIVIKT